MHTGAESLIVVAVGFDSDFYRQCLKLRERVLRQPLGLSLSSDDTAGEEQQYHYAIVNGQQVLACVILQPQNEQTISLRQMAVEPEFQGQGLGQRLVRVAENHSRAAGYKQLHMDARCSAEPFYKKLDYETEGERYLKVGIEHIKMKKRLK